MFVAIRMRAVWLSQGADWAHQPWVCVCMQYCTWSILATALIVAVIPLFTGELMAVDDRIGDLLLITMKCVINLTIQYMIIYSALAVARTAADGLRRFGLRFVGLLQLSATVRPAFHV